MEDAIKLTFIAASANEAKAIIDAVAAIKHHEQEGLVLEAPETPAPKNAKQYLRLGNAAQMFTKVSPEYWNSEKMEAAFNECRREIGYNEGHKTVLYEDLLFVAKHYGIKLSGRSLNRIHNIINQ